VGIAVGVVASRTLEKEQAQITKRANRAGIKLNFVFIGAFSFHRTINEKTADNPNQLIISALLPFFFQSQFAGHTAAFFE
jgi:hypothetical protein